MTFRTKSRGQQWMLWMVGILVALAAYVVLSRVLYNSSGANLLEFHQQRLFLPIAAFFVFFAWEVRWDGIVREKDEEKAEEEASSQPLNSSPPQPSQLSSKPPEPSKHSLTPAPSHPAPTSSASSVSSDPLASSDLAVSATDDNREGEAFYAEARALKHQPIPDFEVDGNYLELIGKAAAKGYPRALARLGDYAMRRCAWVEAYYWMWLARKKGMQNLEPTLREIRRCWAMDDFPVQSSNVNVLFSKRAGSIGRALLGIDSGHEASAARTYLKAEAPSFLA